MGFSACETRVGDRTSLTRDPKLRAACGTERRIGGFSMSQPLNTSINGSDTASATKSASRSTGLKWAIDQARRELLDPSRRNRLLHAPLTGKRPWCMAVVGHNPDE